MSTFFNCSLSRTVAFLGAIYCCVAASLAFGQQPYQVVDHWKIGGIGGWDYLLADPPAHLIYLTHGPQVEVVDTTTGKAIATIGGMKGTHGIALDAENKYGYISDGGGNNVVVFDRHSFKIITTIPAGTNPDGIVFEPTTKSVWAFNGRKTSLSSTPQPIKSSPRSMFRASRSFPSPMVAAQCTTTLSPRMRSSASTPAR
jgi:DNA-binding beta-propeller fold protein YncE